MLYNIDQEDLDGDGQGDACDSDQDGDGYQGEDPEQGLFDCDDLDATVHPGADEVCNEIDDNCDLEVDNDSLDALPFYLDADGDGFGDASEEVASCAPPEGYVANSGDCDDTLATVYPGADEVCNGIDDDCDEGQPDGGIDEGLTFVPYYPDDDGDGFGYPEASGTTCDTRPEGTVETGDDCDDAASQTYPGAQEICDGLDNDCDCLEAGEDCVPDIDESPVDGTAYYIDGDQDGYGAPGDPTIACAAPDGLVANDEDCDDTDPSTYPGALEDGHDATDHNCDGSVVTPTPEPEATPTSTPVAETTPTPAVMTTPTVVENTPTPAVDVTPTPATETTPTPVAEVTLTPTPESTATPLPTPGAEVTPTPVTEISPTPTDVSTPAPTQPPQDTATPAPTPTYEATPTPTPEDSATPTPSPGDDDSSPGHDDSPTPADNDTGEGCNCSESGTPRSMPGSFGWMLVPLYYVGKRRYVRR